MSYKLDAGNLAATNINVGGNHDTVTVETFQTNHTSAPVFGFGSGFGPEPSNSAVIDINVYGNHDTVVVETSQTNVVGTHHDFGWF